VSSQIQPHAVVGTTHWSKLRAGARKGADAETVTGVLDLARRAENRGNLGKSIPWTHLPFKKSARVILAVSRVNIKVIIGLRELGYGIVNILLDDLWWRVVPLTGWHGFHMP